MSLLKDKRALYVLLPLVVLIWSAVGWQVYQGVAGSNEYTPPTFELGESAPRELRKCFIFSAPPAGLEPATL